jgi:hypothetical protein
MFTEQEIMYGCITWVNPAAEAKLDPKKSAAIKQECDQNHRAMINCCFLLNSGKSPDQIQKIYKRQHDAGLALEGITLDDLNTLQGLMQSL